MGHTKYLILQSQIVVEVLRRLVEVGPDETTTEPPVKTEPNSFIIFVKVAPISVKRVMQ